MSAAGASKSRISKPMSDKRPSRLAALNRRAAVFAALGDETRLTVLARLSGGEPQSIARLTDGSRLQQFGEDASIVWVFHGWIFLIYCVVTFFLSRRAAWSVPFTILVLAAGLIPLLIFWVEHRVMQKLKEENPDLTGVADSPA